MFSLLTNSERDADSKVFGNYLSVSGSSVLYFSNHESFVPIYVGPWSSVFFYKWQCTKKLGFKNIFNEEFKLYQPKETCEYIFSKSFWFILQTNLVECQPTMYVWDELYFFKGSYSIRITQWSWKVIDRKRLFKEISMLLQERLTYF